MFLKRRQKLVGRYPELVVNVLDVLPLGILEAHALAVLVQPNEEFGLRIQRRHQWVFVIESYKVVGTRLTRQQPRQRQEKVLDVRHPHTIPCIEPHHHRLDHGPKSFAPRIQWKRQHLFE